MLNPNPQTGQQQMLFKVTDRMIMTYSTVKRLTWFADAVDPSI